MTARRRRRKVQWIWLPTFLVYAVALWRQSGIAAVGLSLLLAVALIVVAERRAEKRDRGTTAGGHDPLE